MRKVGLCSATYDRVYIKSAATISGPKEAKGPMADYIDISFSNLYCNQNNWEQAECQLLSNALDLALIKANLTIENIDLVISGDLNNQLAVSNYVMRSYDTPYIGIYGACSTSVLSIINGASYLESGFGHNILCLSSSHNATSERQFRYPTEYGGQKPNSLTTTVTGSGACVISTDESDIRLIRSTIGVVYDAKIYDSLDMGRAMAPAAALTFRQHLEDFNILPSEYDLILTGDLSKYGSIVFEDLMEEFSYTLLDRYNDCGLMIYDPNDENSLAGGSGCACAAIVMYSYVVNQLRKGLLNKVLIIATGALLNPIMIAQKESIPAIAHAIALERVIT